VERVLLQLGPALARLDHPDDTHVERRRRDRRRRSARTGPTGPGAARAGRRQADRDRGRLVLPGGQGEAHHTAQLGRRGDVLLVDRSHPLAGEQGDPRKVGVGGGGRTAPQGRQQGRDREGGGTECLGANSGATWRTKAHGALKCTVSGTGRAVSVHSCFPGPTMSDLPERQPFAAPVIGLDGRACLRGASGSGAKGTARRRPSWRNGPTTRWFAWRAGCGPNRRTGRGRDGRGRGALRCSSNCADGGAGRRCTRLRRARASTVPRPSVPS